MGLGYRNQRCLPSSSTKEGCQREKQVGDELRGDCLAIEHLLYAEYFALYHLL